MRSTRSIFRGLAIAAVLSLVSSIVFADTIRLKDGSIIKGKIMSYAGGTFSVEIGEGQRKRSMTFTSDQVESIQFDAQQGPAVARQSSQSTDRSDEVIKVSTTSTRPPAETSTQPRVVTTDPTPPQKTQASVPKTDAVKSGPSNSSPRSTAPGSVDPISINVKVLADNTANGWTNSGWVVRKGQRIRVTGDGEVSLGRGQTSTPAGLPDLTDDQKLLKGVATGALIAVIGDDNNDFIYIGSEREFTATRDGTLFLGLNEGNLNDNSGSFNVTIQIVPGSVN